MILGIDEVGRGPWAGPLVVGAVVLPAGLEIEGLTDSKKLSEKRRMELDIKIREQALGLGLGWVAADELDAVGLSEALKLATIRAVEMIKVPYHEIIIDGTVNFLAGTKKGEYVQTIPKADLLVPAVSAASIIAKVARDNFMKQQHLVYLEYGFDSHVGYGTARHAQALEKYGLTPLHRTSFAPVAKITGVSAKRSDASDRSRGQVRGQTNNLPQDKTQTQTRRISSNLIGNKAEVAVSDWLVKNGFKIVERNWKTRYCEIDIIAQKNDETYFIEVKYRASAEQGGGLAAITSKKLAQMRFAAELYMSRFGATNPKLAAVAVDALHSFKLVEIDT